MSDPIRHECGIAVVRLLKPLAYYHDKYGSALYGFDKLYALMAKQRNRGQDGVGFGCCKLNMPPGQPYLFRVRSTKSAEAIGEAFADEMKEFGRLELQGEPGPRGRGGADRQGRRRRGSRGGLSQGTGEVS